MKYRLTDKIGSGGMAEVFLATGEGPEGYERSFVVKRILPRLSEAPEFVRMFVDEAKISARLVHPNIVQVFEFAYQDGSYYIVMEAVDGVDMGHLLRQLEREKKTAPAPFVTELGRQACRALEFAHGLTSAEGKAFGIVHRDVTPPNIMVAWNGTVKILDFGIARAVQELRTSLTDAGMVKGKMSYVAPEQLLGQPADARSDVFSLGVVLHELLVGRRLFVGENDLETLKLVRDMPVPLPSEHNPEVKPALDQVIMRALARNPDERYQSASEMGDDLEALVLRKRYSTRAFAKKARELIPPADAVVPSKEEAPAALGGESIIVLDEVSPRAPVVPPPPPPAAVAQPPRAKAPFGVRELWIAAAVPTLATLALMVAVVHDPAPPPPPPLPPPAVVAVAPPPSPTVQVTLDSVPQGAAITLPPDAAGEAKPLGETPMVLRLPRSDTPVDLELSKAGFATLPFKVVPNENKTAVASFDHAIPLAALLDATPRRRAGAARRRALAALAAVASLPSPELQRATAGAPVRLPGAEPLPPPATTTVRFRNDAGDSFKLVEARFVMDGKELPVVTSAQPGKETVVYAGPVRPGRHVMSTRFVYQGNGQGPFTYMNGYKVNLGSEEVLNVPADRPADFTIATQKKPGMNIPIDKQLSVTLRDSTPAAARPR
jgi:serine/threonine protein kinase